MFKFHKYVLTAFIALCMISLNSKDVNAHNSEYFDNKPCIEFGNVEVWVDDLASKRIQICADVKDSSMCIDTMFYTINGGEKQMLQSKVADGDFKVMTGFIPSRCFENEGAYTVEIWIENESGLISESITKQINADALGFTTSDLNIPECNRITFELENVDLFDTSIAVGSFGDFTVVAKEGYTLPKEIAVEMGVRILDKTEYTYNFITGQISLMNIIEDTKITIEGILAEI